MSLQYVRKAGSSAAPSGHPGGLAHWLLSKIRSAKRTEPHLALIERINLAPRQTLALVEAEGRRFLVASSPEGASSFYPLTDSRAAKPRSAKARVSW